AYTLPIARTHEFEADAAAADVSGREVIAVALVKGVLAARWADESYWPKIYERADDEAAPPQTAFAPMAEGSRRAAHSHHAALWYRQLREEETSASDSHPWLSERIAHLGLDPEQVLGLAQPNGGPPAASAFLGAAEPEIVAAVDRAWREGVTAGWSARHFRGRGGRPPLHQLQGGGAPSGPDGLTAAARARATRS